MRSIPGSTESTAWVRPQLRLRLVHDAKAPHAEHGRLYADVNVASS
jgi:hypothetical protein